MLLSLTLLLGFSTLPPTLPFSLFLDNPILNGHPLFLPHHLLAPGIYCWLKSRSLHLLPFLLFHLLLHLLPCLLLPLGHVSIICLVVTLLPVGLKLLVELLQVLLLLLVLR